MQIDAETEPNVTLPEDLESPRAKLVYLYLAAYGTARVDRLCGDLGMKKGTVLSISRSLRDRGHLEREDGKFVLA
ncbi:helix-turn-helix domain-containing protein [Halopiger goleimassiliensis]|uniref:helix-turn-helix domain-containing protein n=1 Tax=Halopiger goleimassiliensis TaxID=1293048 RepID=UPI00067799F3|nr:helix-turn-helix domain-containing protein [Halopiger goleimassiliensis]